MASPHQLWTLSLSFEVTNIICNFQVLSTDFRRTVNYGIETIQMVVLLFGQNYHLNINLQLPLKNLKWKLRNGYVIHVPADYIKNYNQILGILIRNMVFKNVNLLCFTTLKKNKIKMISATKKITKQLLKMFLVNKKYFV